jgi:hypothetical protein
MAILRMFEFPSPRRIAMIERFRNPNALPITTKRGEFSPAESRENVFKERAMMPCCGPLAKWLVRGLVITACLALAYLAATPGHSQEGAVGSVLTRVPADAIGFVHVKAGAVWKSDMMAGLRETLMKAGGPALDAFNKRFTPPPKTLDSVAFYLIKPDDAHGPAPAFVLGFTEPFEQSKVLKSLMPSGKAKSFFGQSYMEDETTDIAVKVVDQRTLLVSSPSMMVKVLSHEANQNGPMSKHLSSAAAKPIYGAVNIAAIPLDNVDMPESLRPLAAAREAVFAGELGKDLAVKVQLRYADGAAARNADKAARDALQMGRQQIAKAMEDANNRVMKPEVPDSSLRALPEALANLFTLAALKSMDELLDQPPFSQQGDALVLDYRFDPVSPQTLAMASAFMWGTVMPATEVVRRTTASAAANNNLKQIAIAMHNYEATYQYMPAALFSKDGKKPLLSWRVALLPYLEQEKLFREFKLDEPWDSDHNKKLLEKMPDVFKDPAAPPTNEPGMTHYQIFVGGGAGFKMQPQGSRIFEITDGTSNTIMVATTTDPVPWTKPGDITFALGKPLPKLGLGGKPPVVAMFDGSVRSIKKDTSERTIKSAITASGGELMPEDW